MAKANKKRDYLNDISFSNKKTIKQKTKNKKSSKSFIYFTLVLIFIVTIFNLVNIYYKTLNLKEELKLQAISMYDDFLDAGKFATNMDITEANMKIEEIKKDFEQVQDRLWFIKSSENLQSYDYDLIKYSNNLINAFNLFLNASKHGLNSIEKLNNIPIIFVQNNKLDTPVKKSITDELKLGLDEVEKAIKNINEAEKLISEIDEKYLPKELQDRVKDLKENLKTFSDTLKVSKESFPAILKLLGDKVPHRYLIIFQNNDEIRATGGFIGSYAIVDLNDGIIDKFEVQDVYDLDGSYGKYIEPPEDFKIFITNWRFRDANFYYDFPTSAKKLMWFLEEEGGPSVDTVIAVNQGILPELLNITGPISIENFGELSSENVNLLLTYVIESKMWGAEDPKSILKVFVEEFRKEILNEKYIAKVLSKVYKAIQKEHILFYSKDEDIQKLFEEINADGKAHESKENEDYLAVINTSIGGNKSDKFVDENIKHITKINEDGSLVNTVEIRKTHLYSPQILDSWLQELNKYDIYDIEDVYINILGRGDNKSIVQVFVPKGAKFIESNQDVKLKYDERLKKSYFVFVQTVKAGESDTVEIKYELPFSLDQKKSSSIYKFYIDKQPGSYRSSITKDLIVAPDSEILDTFSGNVLFADDLSMDRYYSALIKN